MNKDKQKINRARVCIECENNKNSYCLKHEEPCFKVNYICSGGKNPYEYKIPAKKHKKIKIKKQYIIKN